MMQDLELDNLSHAKQGEATLTQESSQEQAGDGLRNVVALHRSKTEILAEVRALIETIIGQSVDMNDQEISLETSFSRDLELESIEFVVLSEHLQHKYGANLDFAGWLAAKELHDIINLKVGDIVGFIHQWHT